MEKIKKSISINLPILKIYLDEIEQILDIMKENSESKVEIITSEHKIENMVELNSLKLESLNYLELKISDPYLSIDLGPRSSLIYCSEDSAKNLGLVSKIRNVIEKGKRNIINILASYKFLLILGFIWFFIIPFFYRNIIIDNNLMIIWYLSFLLVMIIFFFFNYLFTLKYHSTIILKYRRETPNFFKRNRDRIIFTILGFILGIISIIVSQYITNYLF